jgi:predicted nucleic acid-binding protein
MSVRSFFDSNVILYADDKHSRSKQRRSIDLIEEHRRAGTGVVSNQVLQEYFSVVTRKLGLPATAARKKVEFFSRFQVATTRPQDILAAIDLHRLHGISFWDAMIIRASQATGCPVIFSEDMQHGRDFEGTRIVNPFL